MSFCTACGQRLVPDARFCTRCGAPVAPPPTGGGVDAGDSTGGGGRPGGVDGGDVGGGVRPGGGEHVDGHADDGRDFRDDRGAGVGGIGGGVRGREAGSGQADAEAGEVRDHETIAARLRPLDGAPTGRAGGPLRPPSATNPASDQGRRAPAPRPEAASPAPPRADVAPDHAPGATPRPGAETPPVGGTHPPRAYGSTSSPRPPATPPPAGGPGAADSAYPAPPRSDSHGHVPPFAADGAGGGGGAGTGGAGGTGPAWFAPRALTQPQLVAAVRNAAITLAGSLAVLFVLVMVCASAAAGEHTGAAADWFRAAVAVLAAGVHAPVRFEGPFVKGSVSAMPFVATALVVGLAWAAARFTVRRGPETPPRASSTSAASPPPAHPMAPATIAPFALLTGVLAGLVAAVLAASSAGPLAFVNFIDFGYVTVHAAPIWTFLLMTVVVAGSTFLGAGGAALLRDLMPADRGRRFAAWSGHARLGRDVVLATLAAGALAVLVVLILGGSDTPKTHVAGQSVSGDDWLWPSIAALPNLVVLAAGFLLGGTAAENAQSTDDSHSHQAAGLLAGNVEFSYLAAALGLTAVFVLVAGLRGALRRTPDGSFAGRWWQPAAVVALAWLVLAAA